MDEEPPVLQSDKPEDYTMSCKELLSNAAPLLFTENCGEDIVVEGTEGNATGSVCDGKTLVRTWKGPADACGNSADDLIQTITILDQAPPQLPEKIKTLTYECPQDFVLASIDPPSATDDCTASVAVTGSATKVDNCTDVTITWTATDDCGQTSTIEQTAKISDSVPPAVIGAMPADVVVGCGHFPAEAKLTFWDFCAGDIEVFSKDSLPIGTVCNGQEYTRTWEGPSDSCGNTAATVTQTITVMDLGAPDLPDELEDIVLSCPSDFNEHALVAPNATDDCDKTVLVQKEVPNVDKCAEDFQIIWTAVDECSKTDSVAQKVRFTGTAPPSISCPTETTLTGHSGIFNHTVSYGDCYGPDDVTITYEATCTDCDGTGCTATLDASGAELTIKDVPAWAKVEWVAKLDYGCGVTTAYCSTMQVRTNETMFGEPQDNLGVKLISDVDDGAKRWGWYKEFTFEGEKDYSFTMHAGAGQSDLSKGFVAGTVVVTAKDCAGGKEVTSTGNWDGIGKAGVCITEPPEDSHHLHVGLDLPRSKKGDISFGPGQFNAGCCHVNVTCFIAVHGVVDEARCGDWGCL